MNMSAIAGVLDLPTDELILSEILKAMQCRDSGAEDVFRSARCTMLHRCRRNKQKDSKVQPMVLSYQGEEYSIVFDGEIFNAPEIKNQLSSQGHKLNDCTHAELMLHAFAQWREKVLDLVNGIFAVAIWKNSTQELFLARDRMGVKPLFYKLHDGGLIFGSEMKMILAYPTVRPELDAEGAAELLLIGPGRTPGGGVFRGIKELEPGCYGCYRAGKWSVERYWELQDHPHEETFEQTAEKVRELVIDAIRRQMLADGTVGAFLSGGLDSSIICSVFSKYKESNDPMRTFSLDYRDNEKFFTAEKFQPETDNAAIKLMLDHLNADQHWTILSTTELFDALKSATFARDLPGMADVDSSLLLFCKEVAKSADVVLSGECSDEIFGGYPWYRNLKENELKGFPWAQNTKYRASFLAPWLNEKMDPTSFVNDKYEQSLNQFDIMPKQDPFEKRMKQMVNLNQRWFMQTLIDRSDRMSACCGLSIRVPLCDYRIAEYMYTVPWEFKDHMRREKGLLRYAMRDLLPEPIFNRKKNPYPKTYDPAYFAAVHHALTEIMADNSAPIFQIVSKRALEDLLKTDYSWPWYGQLMRVPQTIAYMLQINYWLKEYKVKIL